MSVLCPHCKQPAPEEARFCGSCGKPLSGKSYDKEKSSLQLVIFFYITFLVFAIVSYIVYLESDTLATEIALESTFILLTLIFCFFDARNVFSLYRFSNIDWKGLLFSLVFPVITAGLVYFGVSELNLLLFEEDYNMFYDYAHYENPFLWAFIFVAIVAPVFEELAFRGFLFNQLRIIASPQVTIFATAFIFALVHFSWISLIWIFPFGIVLGYLRHKYHTLWLGMIVHFIHNLLVLLLEYYYYLQADVWEELL